MVSCAAAGRASAANSRAAISFWNDTEGPPLSTRLYDNGQINRKVTSLFFLLAENLELRLGLGIRRIEPENRAPLLHPGFDPVLELGLRLCFLRHLLGHVRRDDDHAFGVADHDIAGIDRDAAAADRHLALDRAAPHEVERRGARAAVRRPRQLLDRR